MDLAGDELSMTETAEVFARVTQRPVPIWHISWDDFRDEQGEEMHVMNRWFETTGYHADLNWHLQRLPFCAVAPRALQHPATVPGNQIQNLVLIGDEGFPGTGVRP